MLGFFLYHPSMLPACIQALPASVKRNGKTYERVFLQDAGSVTTGSRPTICVAYVQDSDEFYEQTLVEANGDDLSLVCAKIREFLSF